MSGRGGENAFEDKQQRYYLQQLNQALPVRGGYDYSATNSKSGKSELDTLNTALGTIDPVMPPNTTQMSDAQKFFSSFDRQAKLEDVDAQCRHITTPGKNLRGDPGARSGCGWWYQDDPNSTSVAAHGTRRGPMNPTLQSGGEWIWDMDTAYERESMKQARAIQACPDVDIHQRTRNNQNLGWCITSGGHGIVTDGYGNPAYPNNSGGYCPPTDNGSPNIAMSSGACPPPDPNSAIEAQYAGQVQGIGYLCSPDNNGALSPACMGALAGIACNSNGVLTQSFGGGGYAGSSNDFNSANNYLQQRGFDIHPSIVNDGKTDMWTAFLSMIGVRELASSGKNDKVTNAASNLCFGTPFDPCLFAWDDVGPFPGECIRKLALAMGYSPKGDLLPEFIGQAYWDENCPRWYDVYYNLAWWKGQADTKPADTLSPDDHSKALHWQAYCIKHVHGIDIKFPKQGCNYNGMFMYRYLATTNDTNRFPLVGTDLPFLGRYILKKGFPIKGEIIPTEQTPSGKFTTEAQRMASIFIPSTGGSYTFWLYTSNFTRISINGSILQSTQQNQGWTITQPMDLIGEQSYLLVVDLLNPGGAWSLVVGTSINGAPAQLIDSSQFYMPVNNRAPMLDLSFHKMGLEATTGSPQNAGAPDTQLIFKNLYRWNAPIGQLNGRQCMLVRGPSSGVFNYATYLQGIRLHAIKSITLMIQIDSVKRASNSTTPTIVGFYNTQAANPTGPPRSVNYSTDFPLYGNRLNDFSLSVNESSIFPYGIDPSQAMTSTFLNNLIAGKRASITQGTWMHIAFVWYDDFSGYAIYRDGKLAGNASLPRYDPNLIMEHIRIGCDNQPDGCSWTGGIAWFRAFDYRITAPTAAFDGTSDMELDMADNWDSIN